MSAAYRVKQRPGDKVWCIYLADFNVVIAEFLPGSGVEVSQIKKILESAPVEDAPDLLSEKSQPQFTHRLLWSRRNWVLVRLVKDEWVADDGQRYPTKGGLIVVKRKEGKYDPNAVHLITSTALPRYVTACQVELDKVKASRTQSATLNTSYVTCPACMKRLDACA